MTDNGKGPKAHYQSPVCRCHSCVGRAVIRNRELVRRLIAQLPEVDLHPVLYALRENWKRDIHFGICAYPIDRYFLERSSALRKYFGVPNSPRYAAAVERSTRTT